MTQKEETPRLLKWADDGYPPLDLANEFRAVIALIKYSKSQQAKISYLESLVEMIMNRKDVLPENLRSAFEEKYNQLKTKSQS